jgi:hypothetical protein
MMRPFGQVRLSRVIAQTGRRSAREFWNLLEERNTYRLRFIDAMDAGAFDAIICPPTSLPAARHWREDVVPAVMSALERHFRAQADYPDRPPDFELNSVARVAEGSGYAILDLAARATSKGR